MAEFTNVSMGLGDLSINNENIGYLKDKVNYKYNYDIEQFKTGTPAVLRGQQVKELTAELTATYAEITAANFSMALGGLSVTIQTDTIETSTMESFVCGSFGGAGLEMVQLGPGVGLANTFTSVTVKNAAEAVTYAAGTDYLLDPVNGRLWINPGGSIASGAEIHVTYSYLPINGNRVDLGATFSLAQVPLEFVHVRPNTLKEVVVVMWLCTANGKLDFNFDEGKFILNQVTFSAVADTDSHPSNPFGYFFEET